MANGGTACFKCEYGDGGTTILATSMLLFAIFQVGGQTRESYRHVVFDTWLLFSIDHCFSCTALPDSRLPVEVDFTARQVSGTVRVPSLFRGAQFISCRSDMPSFRLYPIEFFRVGVVQGASILTDAC